MIISRSLGEKRTEEKFQIKSKAFLLSPLIEYLICFLGVLANEILRFNSLPWYKTLDWICASVLSNIIESVYSFVLKGFQIDKK